MAAAAPGAPINARARGDATALLARRCWQKMHGQNDAELAHARNTITALSHYRRQRDATARVSYHRARHRDARWPRRVSF